jgi:hypothetical protein
MYRYAYLLLIVLSVAVCGCSPEAQRTRGGGPGADIGNRDATVQLHGDVPPEQRIFYRTPRKEVGPPGTGRTP